MSKVRNLGFFCLLLFSLITVGFSLNCFQCNSVVDSGCADLKTNDTNSKHYGECSGEYGENTPFCRIYVSNVVNMKEPEKAHRISRSCGWIRNRTLPEVEKCVISDTDFIKKTSCVCFKDGCNQAGYNESPKILILSFFVIAFLRYYLN